MREEKSRFVRRVDELVTAVEQMCGYCEMHGVTVREIVMYTLSCLSIVALSDGDNHEES